MYFERLKTLRKEIKMSQSDIGEFLGIMQTVYSRYERGAGTIPIEHLLKLADLYNVSTDYMLGRTNLRNYDEK
ncbi:MAG: helix-turn-helix transcriptional regulator [Ruminococcaceae bacterium]|nr:helix-turn-helix transcriptional regulator [Oscillospiraceae bacterium]MBR5554074.1 helix-turn-helix transcriptional regulator [Clostridia bacterium]